MDEYILTILKNKNLLDEITFFTDDPIDAFKRMFDTYLEYNLTHKEMGNPYNLYHHKFFYIPQ